MTADLNVAPFPHACVLVVEDEATTRKAVTRALELAGYEAQSVASGEQALAWLDGNRCDLMLLDLRMPGMDGVEVMNRTRQAHPELLVIVLTAHATVESAIEAVRAGAADYLLKPCSLRDIQDAVSRALERQRERLRRQHLIQVMAEALHALQAEEARDRSVPAGDLERFLQRGRVSLDRHKRLAVVRGAGAGDGGHAELTENEAALLAVLMAAPGRTFSCRELARQALGYDLAEAEAQDIVRPHISRLRKKIEPEPPAHELVCTVRGQGYYFSDGD
ncbi:MAG: response regulator transcription factor [Anaerolineae bacterium]